MNSLIESLKKVNDFRRKQGQKYPLWLILLIVILGLMAGHLEYRALGDFAKSQQILLKKYFHLRSLKTPSYSTIRRTMMGVDWSNLMDVFNQWSSQLAIGDEECQWLAIDGKSLKSTVENHQNSQQNFVSIISVFCQKNGLVLHLSRIENKNKSELHQVQDIARDSGIHDRVFTLDALHCQKQTVQAISEGGNDYLIAVKKNQLTLYKSLKNISETATPLSQNLTQDISHGRNICRKVSVFELPDSIKSLWTNSQRFIQIERSGTRGGKPYQEVAYQLSSCQENAQIFAESIRGHWGIENKLHWVKDVIFKEDKSRLHQFQPVTNFSILSTIAINLFRILGFLSITEGRRWLGERFSLLTILLA